MADDLSLALKDDTINGAQTDGWHCLRCGALWITKKPAHWRCGICGAEVEHQRIKNYRRPRYYLPFFIDQETAEDICLDLLKKNLKGLSKHFCTSALEGLQQIYLSYWVFDLNSIADYTAQSGQEIKENRKRNTAADQNNINWLEISGSYSYRFNSLTVTAVSSTGVRILPTPDEYNLMAMQPLADVPQVAVMGYDLDLKEAWSVAQLKVKSQITTAVEQQLCGHSGELIRGIRCHIDYKDVRFRQVLLPVWLSCCVYHRRTYNIVINGVSGKVKGKGLLQYK